MPEITTTTLPGGTVGLMYDESVVAIRTPDMQVHRGSPVNHGSIDDIGTIEAGVDVPVVYGVEALVDDLIVDPQPYELSSTNATSIIGPLPAAAIEALSIPTFEVSLNGTAVGLVELEVAIDNDSGTNPYTFTIQ